MTTLYKCNCGNHFTFPKSAIPSLLPQPTPPALPPAPPPSLPVVLPTQLPSQPLASSISRTKCGNHPCGRVAHRSCLNHMCKQCCIICAGGCHLADHKTSRLSTRQQEKLQVALPAPYFLPVPDPRPRSPIHRCPPGAGALGRKSDSGTFAGSGLYHNQGSYQKVTPSYVRLVTSLSAQHDPLSAFCPVVKLMECHLFERLTQSYASFEPSESSSQHGRKLSNLCSILYYTIFRFTRRSSLPHSSERR